MSVQASASDAVIISGIGICTPMGKGQVAFADAVISNQSAIRSVTSFDGSALDSDLASEFSPADRDFGLSESELARTDRGAWFAVAALDEALDDAGLDLQQVDPERIAVVVGTSHSGIQHIEAIYQAALAGRVEDVTVDMVHAASTDHTASVVCAYLGARGPRATISSACASSNTAVGYGYDLLNTGEADVVVVVGTDTVSPSILAGFNCLRAVSREPAAPFSTPSGISLGEGAGVLILESHANASRRGRQARAQIRGYGLSGDAYHETATDPEGRGVEAAMREALRNADTAAEEVDYVSAHGTGTNANDIPEAIATARVFGPSVPLSSSKSILGHTLGASGVIELILTLLLAERGLLPQTANFKGVRAGCPELDYVPVTPRPGRINTFLCNNYGFGGNNSSLVVSRSPRAKSAVRSVVQPVVLTGGGVVSAVGATSASFFEAMWSGRSGVVEANDHASPVGKVTPISLQGRLKGYMRSSPMIKFAIAAVGQAIDEAENGDAALISKAPGACALVAGVSHGAERSVEKFMESVFSAGLQYASATHFPMTTLNASGGQVSIAYGIKGYNTTFCGASTALKYAFDLVQDGRQQRAVTFGTDEISPLLTRLLDCLGYARHDVVVPFSSQHGVNPGEGAGAIILESASAAAARGASALATIRSVGLAQDGRGGAVDPEGLGLARAISAALARAALEPTNIAVVVAVGTGTVDSRMSEVSALTRVFGDRLPPTTGATGAVGYASAALLHMHILLAAEILRRTEVPPASQARDLPPHVVAGEVRAIPDAKHALVVFTSLAGEHCAVVVGR